MKNFVLLTRNELRGILGGIDANSCASDCTSDSDCRTNSPNGYCGNFTCYKKGYGNVRVKICTLNDPQP